MIGERHEQRRPYVLLLLLVLACTDESGVTPDCPSLSLYDGGDMDAAANTIVAERTQAARQGCITEAGVARAEPSPSESSAGQSGSSPSSPAGAAGANGG